MMQPDPFKDGASATPAAASQAAQGAAAGPNQTAGECSAEALQKVDDKILRQWCLEEYARRVAGATADEICKALKYKIPGAVLEETSIRPRVSQLKKEGILVPTGEKRVNRKNNACTVLVHWKFSRREET